MQKICKKIYELSLEKLNKKLDDQTKKLVFNNNIGINKLLKQTKIIKNNFKQIVSHQINNINDAKNMQKNMKSDEIINSNNNNLNIKEEILANKLIKNQQLFHEKINYMQKVLQQYQQQLIQQQQQQQLYQQQNINQNNNKFHSQNNINYNTNSSNTVPESHQIDLSQFMNEALKTFKTAKTAMETIVNE
eukprot:121469_1